MRNDDLTQSGHNLTANDDYDVIKAGSGASATGNTISGRGTVSGAAGADDTGMGGAHVTGITGAGGGDAASMEASGRYGAIKIDAQGNYTYTRNANSPDNVEDVFSYTLADKSGTVDSARLIVRIEGTEEAVKADAQRIVAGNEVITLPAGVELSDIHVVGRDLVINLPDGTQMVIVDGAVFVPQLALGDVELPADTLASLLIDSEPRPAAGPPESSGGNFGEPVAPLDPGVPLGDLLPPTELDYTPPTFEETYIPQKPDEDEPDFPPEVFVQPDGQPASVAASDEVDEAGLNSPPNDHEGTESGLATEATGGNIVFNSPDGVDTITITINGTDYVIYGPGAVSDIPGDYGTLHINSVNVADGTASYTYTLNDNVDHDSDSTPWEDFIVTLTDDDGDEASATLRINIADDAPIANPDVDSVTEDAASNVADGNVFTGSGGSDTNGTDGVADVQGADGAHVSAFSFNGTAGVLGGASLPGNYGSLTMGANGLYSYALNNANPTVQALGVGETLTEIYSYTIIDNDGSTSTTTLTITINGANDAPMVVSGSTAVTEEAFLAPEDNQGNPDGVGNPTDTASSASANGSLSITDVDGDTLTVTLGAPAGTFYSHGTEIEWTVSPDGHTLTGSANGGSVVVVTIDNAGNYTVNLLEQIDHPVTGTSPATSEDILPIIVPVHANDGTVTVDGSLTVNVEDDSPVITGEATISTGVDLDESDSGTPTLSPAGAITVTSTGAIISAPVSYGGDGPGGSAAYSLTLKGAVEGYKDSGLVTADGNHAITLHQIDATHIEGVFNDGSDHVAFTVTIDAGTGQVTVTQNYALEHSDDGSSAVSHNDTNSPLTLEGLINANVTYEDFDHDTVEATAEIGGGIRFFDDGPTATVTVQLPEGEALDGLALVTSDDGTEGAGSTTDSTTVNFGGAFGLNADGGADGLKSSNLAFDLDLIGAGDGPVDSGLDSHGATIYLYQVDANTIIGSTSATLAGADLGNTVFQLSTTDAGAVTLTQYQQVDHPAEVPSGSPFGDQFASLGAGLIRLAGTGTAVDNDDDTASDTEYLDLGGLVRFGDDGPAIEASLKEGAHLIVDESLPGTAAGESEPAGTLGQVSVAISSLISVTDTSVSADAPTTYSYALVLGAPSGGHVDSGLMTSAGDNPIYLYNVGGTIVGSTALTSGTVDASNTVFSVAISGGNVVLTQYQAVEQGDAPLNYNELSSALAQGALGLQVTATDYDGDTATSTVDLGSVIQFNDDGPVATVTTGSLPTDPAALAAFQLETSDNGTEGAGQTSDSTTANFGGLFGLTADGGSDGAASSSLTFDLNLVGAGDGPIDSGLDSHGQTIYLYQINANTIVGSTSATAVGVAVGNTVFQLATTDGGAVTLTQYMQVDHSAEVPSGAPFGDQVTSLGGGLVQIVATGSVTDNDGDIATDTESLDLGGLVRFADDGPAIDATIKGGASLHIDESVPGTDGAGETDATGLGQVTVALSAIVNIADTSVSADAPTTYGYALNLGPATGGLVASGLLTSDGNNPIYLYNVGGTIVGSTSAVADGSGINLGNTIFTVAISGGNVVMTQFQAIEHTNTSNFDENSLPLTGGALNLVVTATDYDGDTATDTVDLGSIVTFGDDGPVVLDRTVPGTQPEDANVVINVTADIDGGSDGLDHVEIVSKSGPGTLTFNPATGEFTYDPINGESGTVSFVYRVFDKDGDHDDATVTFDLAADSTPTVIVTDLTVDEKGLPNGTGELANPAPNTDNSETASGTMTITTGSDTLGAVEVQDKDGNWVNVTGATVGTPVLVQGSHGTLSVTSDGAGHYSYSYTLTTNYLTHPDHFPAGVDGDGISGAADEIAGDNFAVRVSDNEGDMTTVTPATTINVTVRDDAPTVSGTVNANGAITLDESATSSIASTITLVGITKGDDLNVSGTGAIAKTVGGASVVTAAPVYGADGQGAPLSYALSIQNASSGLTLTDGTAINLVMNNGSIVGVVAGAGPLAGQAAFAIAIDPATGALTVEQYLSLNHPNALNPDDAVSMTAGHIGVVITATDGDLDQASSSAVDISTQISFEDDGPTVTGSANGAGAVVLDESATSSIASTITLVGITKGDDLDVSGTGAIAKTVGTAAVVNAAPLYGSDGAHAAPSLSYALSIQNASSGLTLTDGTAINLVMNNGSIVGVVASGALVGQAAFAIQIDPSTGVLTVEQYLSLNHPNALNPDDAVSMTAGHIGVVITATDGDNDTASSTAVDISAQVSFEDDGPTVTAAVNGAGAVTLDESATSSLASTITLVGITKGDDPHVSGTGAIAKTVGSASIVTATPLYGADGAHAAPSLAYALSIQSASSGLTLTDGTAINLVMNNGSIVGVVASGPLVGQAAFAISINASSGVLTVEQYLSLKHPDAGNPDDSINMLAGHISATVTATDGDNDTGVSNAVDISTQVKFEDDGPTTFTPDAATVTNNAVGLFTGFLDTDDLIGNNMGADGGIVRFPASVDGTNSGMTSGGSPIIYHVSADGQTLYGDVGATHIFTVTLNQAASTYTLDMNGTIDSLSQIDFTGGAYDHPGGNPDYYAFFISGNNDSSDLLITPMQGNSTGGTINLNGNLFGVSTGNDVGAGDSVRLDYVRDLVTSGGSIGQWSFEQHYVVNGATVEMAKANNATVKLTAYDDPDGNNTVGDGSTDTINKIVINYNGGQQTITPTTTDTKYTIGGHDFWVKANGDGTVSVGGVTGDTNGITPTTIAVFTANGYNSLVMTYENGPHGSDSFKVGGFGAAVQSTDPVHFDIPIQIVDGDGDTIGGTAISVTANAVNPPVVLDTNHDGSIGFLGMDAGVLYDMNGDGHLDQTAWAASGDSILFRDADHNGTVSGASEFVFGGNGMTDLEALHAMYGAQLDAGDADFTMFALWNDANSNGIVDAGEVSTLAEAGITSIGLTSDGVTATAADGDVAVHGTGSFSYVNDNGDSSTGTLADASFAWKALSADDEQRQATSGANSTVVAAAVAAAGLAEQAAAAAPASDDTQQADAPAVNTTPTIATVSPVADEPNASPLVANDDVRPAEAAPSAHHNAVVAEDSGAPIEAAADSSDAQDSLLVGTDLPAVDSTPLVDVAPLTVAAEAAAPEVGDRGGHQNAVTASEIIQQPETMIEKVLAQLNAGDSDQLAVVQGAGHTVQGWDMGDFAHLPAAVMEHMGAEASLLHPDAVQPVMHG